MSERPESDGGLHYLEQKLGIFIQGPAQTRRNAALDILTGRVADDRLLAPGANKPKPTPPIVPVPPVAPARTHPSVAHRNTRPAHLTGDPRPPEWTPRLSASPWLAPTDTRRPRFRIEHTTPPAPSRGALVRSLVLAAAITVSVVIGGGLGVRSFFDRADVGQPSAIAVDSSAEAVILSDTETPLAVPEPTIASVPTIAPGPPTPAPASVLRVLLDERFTSNAGNWPNDPQGSGWFGSGAYRLATSRTAHFVALAVPGAAALGDTVVTAAFHKLGGPAGGGYGLILRDQDPAMRDGQNQVGHYYVFEVGDKGEVGVWLRDDDRWIDLLTWTASDAVRPGTASNQLSVAAAGDQLSFVVNGIPVANQTDTVLRRGAAGVFVGGDGNEVALERIAVSAPR